MKQFHFYDEKTGLLHGNSIAVNGPEDAEKCMVLRNTPEGHKPIEGNLHHLKHRVDTATGEVVDYQPPPPSAEHVWDTTTKTWNLNPTAMAKMERRRIAYARIAILDNSTIRALREHALGLAGAADRLKAIDAEIATLRSDLKE